MKKYNLLRIFISVIFIIWFNFMAILSADAATVIKVSLITPEGSAWTNALHNMAAKVKQRTEGEIQFKIYAGGISGDEIDVLRKMRVNRIHAAGFSGVGLGVLLPQVRILEAPLLYRNYAEIDRVKEVLAPEFQDELNKKGYILLGFAEAGFVRFFSKVQMTGPQNFKPLKMWVWKDDPVAKNSLETLGIKTYPLHLTDVNTGLETGMINSFYSPPLAAIAFQWYAKIQYMLDYPMVNSTGAFVIKKRTFARLSPRNQEILREESDIFCRELILQARRQNEESLEVLREVGITFETPSPQQIQLFEDSAQKIYDNSIDRLYSKELFDKVNTIITAYRAGQ